MCGRYKVSHDEMIFDKYEGEFLSLNMVCMRLNQYENKRMCMDSFLHTLAKRINDEIGE